MAVDSTAITSALLCVLVSTAKLYESCVKGCAGYDDLTRDIRNFRDRLENQATVFRNQFRILLEEVVDHSTALAVTYGAYYNDSLNTDLEALLGRYKESFVLCLQTSKRELQQFEKEIRSIRLITGQKKDRKASTDFIYYDE